MDKYSGVTLDVNGFLDYQEIITFESSGYLSFLTLGGTCVTSIYDENTFLSRFEMVWPWTFKVTKVGLVVFFASTLLCGTVGWF